MSTQAIASKVHPALPLASIRERVSTAVAPRILIFTASIGEGHDLPARVLAEDLRERCEDAEIVIEDSLQVLGGAVVTAAESSLKATFAVGRMHWVFDLQYFIFARLAPSRRLGQALLYRLKGRALKRFVERAAPDVIVSTYPVVTDVLGRLRRAGRLDVPVCSAITDLAALRYWAHPGVDLHLVTHPESLGEVAQIAGSARALAVNGLNHAAFLSPPDRDVARAMLDLPPDTPVVAVSGGGWGVGDLAGAVEAALAIDEVTVLCLCGRNEHTLDQLGARFAGDPRVRILGFVEDMAGLLAASDVLVHSTAGLTVLEGHMLGCHVISYGWGVGHIRLNNRAFKRFGIADVVHTRSALADALTRALAAPRRPRYAEFAALPSAADAVLAELKR